jgi:hypothetical protein
LLAEIASCSESNRRADSRLLRDQHFGTLATLAVTDGVTAEGFSD